MNSKFMSIKTNTYQCFLNVKIHFFLKMMSYFILYRCLLHLFRKLGDTISMEDLYLLFPVNVMLVYIQ